MTVSDLTFNGFKALTIPSPDREVKDVYIGDLLSWVMGRAKSNDAWITIMSNVNVLAVASLTDVACVILTEGVQLSEDILKTAEEKEINILSTEENGYNTAIRLWKII